MTLKRVIQVALLLLLLPFISDASSAYVTRIDGEIKAGTVQYINRAIDTAESAGAEYFIIEIDTPGGLVESTKSIVDSLLETDMKVITFAHKKSGWVYSAGSFIILSSDYSFARPDSSIGAAEPRDMMGDSLEDSEKISEAMSSWVRSLAGERDGDIAEKFVKENLVLSGSEALEMGIIDGTAESLDDVLNALNINKEDIVFLFPGFFDNLFDTLSHPYLVSLFLSLGALGLVFAFRTGEFEISGALGLILLLMGLWGIGVINFNVLGVFLVLLGVILLGLELFTTAGFGVIGTAGIMSLALGIFNFGAEPFLSPQLFDFVTLFTIGVLLCIFILFVVIMRGVALSFNRKAVTGSEALLGEKGSVVKDIDPVGRVELKGESWLAKSETSIKEGEEVKVLSVEGNKLIVRKVEEENKSN